MSVMFLPHFLKNETELIEEFNGAKFTSPLSDLSGPSAPPPPTLRKIPKQQASIGKTYNVI
jgi:hypothetical protein